MGKPRKSPIAKSVPSFSLSLRLGDKTYTSTGATVREALATLPRPEKIVAKGTLTIEGNGKYFERLFFPQKLRLFLRPIATDIQAKMLSAALK